MALARIAHYFPALTAEQHERLEQLIALLREWNQRINLISRKDIDYLEERHVLHALAPARFFSLPPEAQVLDLGTGGGLPGLPLAICFPQTHFTLVDSIAKKMRAVAAIQANLRLPNIRLETERAERLDWRGDYILARAVAPMPKLVGWTKDKLPSSPPPFDDQESYPPRGWLALKGGDLSEELKPFRQRAWVFPLREVYQEDFFEDKKLVYLPKIQNAPP